MQDMVRSLWTKKAGSDSIFNHLFPSMWPAGIGVKRSFSLSYLFDYNQHDCILMLQKNRTIMALWRTRTLPPDQKAQIVEEQQDQEEMSSTLEDTGFPPDSEDSKMSRIFAAELPISVSSYLVSFLILTANNTECTHQHHCQELK